MTSKLETPDLLEKTIKWWTSDSASRLDSGSSSRQVRRLIARGTKRRCDYMRHTRGANRTRQLEYLAKLELAEGWLPEPN